MSEEIGFPVPVSGKIRNETKELMKQAGARFGVTEGALVRMALEDYMPRYLANQGKPQHAELFAKLAQALDEKPELADELTSLAKKATHRRRVAA